jgi:hypothetical protein
LTPVVLAPREKYPFAVFEFPVELLPREKYPFAVL